jgi:hypothetical protein
MENTGRISRKFALLLTVILALIFFSEESADYAGDIRSTVDDMLNILSKKPAPDEMETLLRQSGAKNYTLPRFTENRIKVVSASGMMLSFWVEGGRAVSVSGTLIINLKRGLPFELLEKDVVDSLERYFGHSPEIVPVYTYVPPFVPEPAGFRGEEYVWKAWRNGAFYDISLSVKHRWPGYFFYYNKLPYIWLKPEQADISFTARPRGKI